MKHIIGVDLGTSVVKSTLFDVEGKAVAEASRAMKIHYPEPGSAEQDPLDYLNAAMETLGEIIEQSEVNPLSVAAIGFDGQMAGAMGIDRSGKPITPWYPSALDTRYQPYLERLDSNSRKRLVELNGAMPFAAPRILWFKEHLSEFLKQIRKVVILPNFVASELAGLEADDAYIDPSYLTYFGLGNTAERCWSEELIGMFDINKELLPRVLPATTVIGKLSQDAASECGLLPGTPLVAGVGDQVAGALGAGIVREGQLLDVAGTFSTLITCIDSYLPDPNFNMLQPMAGPISESHWYSMMYIGGGGLTHRWFCDEFGHEPVDENDKFSSIYNRLDSLAETVAPGSEGLLFIPHLAGRSCPPQPLVRGTWIGFTWTHKKKHFYRALLESIAYDFAQVLNVIRYYLPDQMFSDVRVIGGGADSRLWNSIKSDVLGLPYKRLQRKDSAALGSAIIAGHAVGLFPDMAQTALNFSKTGKGIKPDNSRHVIYKKYSAAYAKSFNQLNDAFISLAALRQEPADI
jgi:xylulokinase